MTDYNLFNSVKESTKNWWVSLLVGIFAIVLGFWCLRTPIETFVALTWLFAIVFMLGGIFEILFAVSNRKILYGWGWNLTGGILDILLGLFLIMLPAPIRASILLYFIGFWIIFRSIWTIGVSTELQQIGVKGWGWLLALAILSLIFSIIFFTSQLLGGVFIVFFVSLALMMYGVFRIWLSFEIKALNKKIKEFEKDIQNE